MMTKIESLSISSSRIAQKLMDYFSRFSQPLTREERLERFPLTNFHSDPIHMRRIGISCDKISPKRIYNIIERYYYNLDRSNYRYVWLGYWLHVIKKELLELEKYTMDNVGRVVIIQNERAIFDFYIIYDINIEEVDTVVVDLNEAIDDSSYISNAFTSFGMILSVGTFGYMISNII